MGLPPSTNRVLLVWRARRRSGTARPPNFANPGPGGLEGTAAGRSLCPPEIFCLKILFRINCSLRSKLSAKPKLEEVETVVLDKIALALLIIGGLNWGSVGLFQFDLVAFACGGSASMISRIIYTVVGLSTVWCISVLFRDGAGKRD